MGGSTLELINVHHNPAIDWHRDGLDKFVSGLQKLGLRPVTTTLKRRFNSAPSILFGTSGFKDIESSTGDYLLIDRACFGDPDYVRLGWNGRDLAATYMVPETVAETRDETRWESLGFKMVQGPFKRLGKKIILCGDYDSVPVGVGATHFRPHPAAGASRNSRLPIVDSFDDCKVALVGRSTVGFQAIKEGVPIKIIDPLAMINLPISFIAWTQWRWNEIEEGEPIRHLFDWMTDNSLSGPTSG